MADVRIEKLDITVEMAGDAGEAAFAAMFNRYIKRWDELRRHAEAARHFAERERVPESQRPAR